jgi:esterase/lipase
MLKPMKNKNINFQKSGRNSSFNCEHMSFNTYVEHMRTVIEDTRQDLTKETRETIVDANSPFEWLPEQSLNNQSVNNHSKIDKIKNGVLLVHGLFDSPNTLLSLAEYFHEKNYLVRTILLPGHGTNPGDLASVSYQEWLKAVAFGIQSFEGQVDNLYLSGFSTGGALILHEALTKQIENLRGLILFAPALKLQAPIAILSNIDKLLRSSTISGIRWLTKSANRDYAKYSSFTLESANEVIALARSVQKLLNEKPLSIPLFMIATEDDEVLVTKSMLQMMKKTELPNNKMFVYGSTLKPNQDERIKILPASYPELRILNFSHMCLAISPDHPHYGLKGDYHEPLYHENGSAKQVKTIGEAPYFGAVTHANLRQHFIQRLTYNPDFDNMMLRINQWIESLKIN